MKKNITIKNPNGEEIGKTYFRRAKNMVSKQKAKWINDKEIEMLEPKTFKEESFYSSKLKNLQIHFIIFIFGLILIYILYAGWLDSYFQQEFFYIVLTLWIMIFFAHLTGYLFFSKNNKTKSDSSDIQSKLTELEKEIREIKSKSN